MATRKRDREKALRAAFARGSGSNFTLAMFRRDVLVQRALRGIEEDMQVAFARHIQAPVLIAVSQILGTRPQPLPPGILIEGMTPLPPPPALAPPGLSGALQSIFTVRAAPVLDVLTNQMTELAEQEVAFVAKGMQKYFGPEALPPSPLLSVSPVFPPTPDPATGPLLPPAGQQLAQEIVRRATTAPVLGALTDKTFGNALGSLKNKVEQDIVMALQRGETTDQIVRMLRGTKVAGFKDGTLGAWRGHNIRALVRTAATGVVANSRVASYAALGLQHYKLVATLDLRTTPLCISLDGNVYVIGEGPLPPFHPNCRTATAPSLGPDKPVVGKRASMDGPVPASMTARDFWDQLPKDDQDFILGKTRAELIRSGKLDWKQLFGPGLEPLRLTDLRARGLIPAGVGSDS